MGLPYTVHYRIAEARVRGKALAPIESTVIIADAEGPMDAVAIAASSLAEGGQVFGRDEQISFTVESR